VSAVDRMESRTHKLCINLRKPAVKNACQSFAYELYVEINQWYMQLKQASPKFEVMLQLLCHCNVSSQAYSSKVYGAERRTWAKWQATVDGDAHWAARQRVQNCQTHILTYRLSDSLTDDRYLHDLCCCWWVQSFACFWAKCDRSLMTFLHIRGRPAQPRPREMCTIRLRCTFCSPPCLAHAQCSLKVVQCNDDTSSISCTLLIFDAHHT
jgi:hypothetical protein